MDSNHLPRRLRRLIRMSLREGWRVEITPDLRLTLRKPGFPPIHTGARANDMRPTIRRNGTADNNDHG